jgi:hypothetical protein
MNASLKKNLTGKLHSARKQTTNAITCYGTKGRNLYACTKVILSETTLLLPPSRQQQSRKLPARQGA